MRELLVPTGEELNTNLHKKLYIAAQVPVTPGLWQAQTGQGVLPITKLVLHSVRDPMVKVAKQDT